jgi:hypothetical protein
MMMTYKNQQLEYEIYLRDNKVKFKNDSTAIKITGARSTAQIATCGEINSLEATITIWGLSREIISTLTQFSIFNTGREFNVIRIIANSIVVYEGTIINCLADFNQAPDIQLRINCLPCAHLMLAIASPFSQSGSVKVADIIRSIITPFDMSLTNIDVKESIPDPYLKGSPYQQILNAAWQGGCFVQFSYNDILIRNKNTPVSKDIINISPESGFIGYPIYCDSGLSVKTYFNESYVIGQKVNLASFLPLADGDYTIGMVTHNLSSELAGGVWESNLLLYRNFNNEQ